MSFSDSALRVIHHHTKEMNRSNGKSFNGVPPWAVV